MIDWVEIYGTVGGYPVKVNTYWEGRVEEPTEVSSYNRLTGKLTLANPVKIAWITRLSNGLWQLTISNKFKFIEWPQNNFREKDVDKLKIIMETIYKEMINKLK
jgi:hypothetical protein